MGFVANIFKTFAILRGKTRKKLRTTITTLWRMELLNLAPLHLPHNNCSKVSYIHIARDDLQRRDLFKPAQYLRSHLDQLPLSAFAPNPPPTSHPTSTLPIVTHTPSTTSEGMCQHFHIWGDKQTIQGLCPNCI